MRFVGVHSSWRLQVLNGREPDLVLLTHALGCFSAWCWWTRTRRVKGLSYKSGTITLEVKTCMMLLTGRNRGGNEKETKRKERGARQACRSYLECIVWPTCLNVFSDEMIFPNDLVSVSHSLIRHTCSLQDSIKQCSYTDALLIDINRRICIMSCLTCSCVIRTRIISELSQKCTK